MKKLIAILVILVVATIFARSAYKRHDAVRKLEAAQATELQTAKSKIIEESFASAIKGYGNKFRELEVVLGHEFMVYMVGIESTPDVLSLRFSRAEEPFLGIKNSLSLAAGKVAEIDFMLPHDRKGADLPWLRQIVQVPVASRDRYVVTNIYNSITGNLDKTLDEIEELDLEGLKRREDLLKMTQIKNH
jgi:hypothetical protein